MILMKFLNYSAELLNNFTQKVYKIFSIYGRNRYPPPVRQRQLEVSHTTIRFISLIGTAPCITRYANLPLTTRKPDMAIIFRQTGMRRNKAKAPAAGNETAGAKGRSIKEKENNIR